MVLNVTGKANLKFITSSSAADGSGATPLRSIMPGGTAWIDLRVPYLPAMTEPPDDNLDHYALGFYAVSKGLRREDCPYAEGIEAHAQWVAGYDEGVKEKEKET
ncbi:MAG: hypothetical protein MIN69_15085 [Methylorubrum extorquens]|jgi:ribosome modulation factor|uniref:hypothetical protein n=1 Tax=Methylorubrum extorquens TaxID=408 RepID=UPI002FEE5BA9